MNDIIIKVDTETGRAVSNTELLGIKGQNLQNKLIFKMSEKIKGIAWCEVRQGNTLSYIALKENNTGYEANILSSLLTTSSVDVSLRITEAENSFGIPVFVSSIVSFKVLDALNATEKMPEEYPSWLDIANAKIQEIENINIESTRTEGGVTITTTDNQGNKTAVELKDGKDGKQGEKGEKGDPGAFKKEIVNELPETGRDDTIYLKAKDDPKAQNKYNEYLYNSETGWECIGDTSVNLENYYNQKQVDEKLDGKQNTLTTGNNIKIEDDTISANLPTYVVDYNATSENKAVVLKKVLDLNRQGISFQLLLKRGNFYYPLTEMVDNPSVKSASFMFNDVEYSGQLTKYGIPYETIAYFNLFMTTNDNSVKTSRFTSYTLQRGNSSNWALGAKNTEEYIPINDFNPSTKKYVDDSIKSAITDTLGGSY